MTDRLTARPTISAVVPMRDEGRNVVVFLGALRERLAALSDDFEIVLVNDGSRDDARERVLEVAEACSVHCVEFSRNFGKEAYLGRVFEEVKRRPNFVVADSVDRSQLADRHGQSG